MRDTSNNFCSKCGRDMPHNVRFCPYCGESNECSPSNCAHCGASIRTGVRFCPNCGIATSVTTEQTLEEGTVVQADVEYMGFWIRLAGGVIDGVLTGTVGLIIDVTTGVPVIGSVISILYYVLFIGLKGQTPGKMALNIQVVDARGQVPGIPRAILREVLGKLVSTVVVFLGFAWIGWDRRKRGWHDHIGGTLVIRKKRETL